MVLGYSTILLNRNLLANIRKHPFIQYTFCYLHFFLFISEYIYYDQYDVHSFISFAVNNVPFQKREIWTTATSPWRRSPSTWRTGPSAGLAHSYPQTASRTRYIGRPKDLRDRSVSGSGLKLADCFDNGDNRYFQVTKPSGLMSFSNHYTNRLLEKVTYDRTQFGGGVF